MKVGLLFGTFDPIHKGHLAVVENAISTNLLDQIWFVVTPQSPFKKNSILTSRKHRFKMVELATQSHSKFFASKIEFQLEYPNYTKPQLWEEKSVPDVLLSGDHNKIKDWRLSQSEAITRDRRPDLWQKYKKN